MKYSEQKVWEKLKLKWQMAISPSNCAEMTIQIKKEKKKVKIAKNNIFHTVNHVKHTAICNDAILHRKMNQ